jgi:hypothetical protein
MYNTQLDIEIDKKTRSQLKKLFEYHEWCVEHDIIVIFKCGPIFLN